MKFKKVLAVCSTTCLIFFSGILYKYTVTINNINNTILDYVDSNDILNNIDTSDDNTAIILKTSEDLKTINDYQVKIIDIDKVDLNKIHDEESIYYEYKFKANVLLENNSNKVNTTINSCMVLEKINGVFSIKSIDDFKSDINKELLAIKKNTNEDISLELASTSLVYTNDILNISLKYPDRYMLTTNSTKKDNNSIKETITFYTSENDKTLNYFTFAFEEKSENSMNKLSQDYISQGYIKSECNYKTLNGTSFTLFEQDFKENNQDIREYILVSNTAFKEIERITIKARIHHSEITNLADELSEIIKSIE